MYRSKPATMVFILLVLGVVSVSTPGVAAQQVYSPVNGHIYMPTGTVTDIAAARAEAAAAGGTLVQVGDMAENVFLTAAFAGLFASSGRIWIGYSDEVTEGSFLWDSGEVSTFTNWNPGEPNNLGPGGTSENYVEMYGTGTWNDISDTDPNRPMRGIIEIPVTTPRILHLSPVPLVDNGSGSFALTAVVQSIEFDNGFVIDDPSLDPLVGASVDVSGMVAGPITTLTSAIFSPLSINIVVTPGTDELLIAGAFAQNSSLIGDSYELSGPMGCDPIVIRTVGQLGSGTSLRTGSGSVQLDNLDNGAGVSPSSLIFGIGPSGIPQLRAVAVNYAAPTLQPEANLGTNGLGALQVGAVGLAPGVRLYNLFNVVGSGVGSPMTPLGAGPLFGLDLQPIVFDILHMPQGVPPFHVTASPLGTYFFGVPDAFVMSGVILDHVAVSIDAGVVDFVSSVQRVTF